MATRSEEQVQTALGKFLKAHSLEDHVSDIDDIVLSYVISILEDLGDSENAEENIDVDQFIEMMDAYIPGFAEINSVEICEWMFELASVLSKKDQEKEETNSAPTSPSIDACLTMAACGGMSRLSVSEQNSAGESERSTSESSDEIDEQIQLLTEMFPGTVRRELEQCLAVSEGNVEKAAQIVLYRQETGTAITTDTPREKRTKKLLDQDDDKKAKERLMSRYAYIDESDDKRTHKPIAPKEEPKKLVRYLDSQVVNTKGQKFTEIKKDDTEEMKKTFINLKPARKYRFH